MNKLSHSASERFQRCPTEFKYWYVDRLRPVHQSAALMFGTAVDAAISSLLKEKDKDPKQVFAYYWRFQELNGKRTYLPTCTSITYAKSDFDKDLLIEEDWKKIEEQMKELSLEGSAQELYGYILEEKEVHGWVNIREERKKLYNMMNWACLYRKGLLMVEAVIEQVLPNIEEVLGVQEYVKLVNDQGDAVVGFADLIARMKGYDVPVVLDFKTSSKEYEADSVLLSPQLTLYVHSLYEKYNTRKAGFIVISKHIRKNKKKICSKCKFEGTGTRFKTCNNEIGEERCNGEWAETIDPKAMITTIINDIPVQTEEIVLQNFDWINESIKNGIFHRNFSSCKRNWGPCPYMNLCFYNNKDDLIQVEKK